MDCWAFSKGITDFLNHFEIPACTGISGGISRWNFVSCPGKLLCLLHTQISWILPSQLRTIPSDSGILLFLTLYKLTKIGLFWFFFPQISFTLIFTTPPTCSYISYSFFVQWKLIFFFFWRCVSISFPLWATNQLFPDVYLLTSPPASCCWNILG